MKRRLFYFTVAVLLISTSYSQSAKLQMKPLAYLGVGAGLDYGGLGLKLECLVVKNIGLFGAAGYNFNQLGTNVGISGKILPYKKSTPVLLAMYGYNAVLKVRSSFGGYSSATTYYGFSAGIGYEFIVGQSQNKFSLAVLVPFRGSDFKKQYDALTEAGNTFFPGVTPVLVSIGFNIAGYGRFKRHD